MAIGHFKFNFTKEQVRELLNGNPDADEWYDAMVEVLPAWEIVTVERVAGFISQCAHESNNFRSLEENLNYSADSLTRVFGRYFGPPPKRNAKEYHRKPEKIANYVYMDQFRSPKGALGNTQPGDGWRFRGRGLKQLTGRTNYAAFGKTVQMTAEQAADYVATKKGAIDSACWFWDSRKLNSVADARDIVKMTKIINGGDIGLADRRDRWNHALRLFTGKSSMNNTTSVSVPKSKSVVNRNTVLKRGSTGSLVKQLQEKLGIKADGVFGGGTEATLKKWQAANGLSADGKAGPNTLEKLLG